ncbi:hypothetical protein H0H81_009326 [Sphagnurus paluster]|uniref:Uncharacterized protein n=1 Tax=Sphagnurus paluster TaxID=117069 RepID=A0A9P7KIT5_9AGAR|nr:hypothetical protein H0H81_009326 [Sphagnurus paluster]
MGNKKEKRKASSPAESTRPAPSRPVTPVYQAASSCDMPDQGYIDYQHTQDYLDYDSSSEPTSPQETQYNDTTVLYKACDVVTKALHTSDTLPICIDILFNEILPVITLKEPSSLKFSKAIKYMPPPPAPPPSPPPMEVSPTTPTGPRPSGATPPTRGNPTPPAPESGAPATPPAPPAVPMPRGKPAPLWTPPAKRAPKHAPPPPLPTQTAPRLSYATALRSKAPRPRKAHPPTTLVAPASTKWVVIPNNKSQLRDVAKRPSPHHIVGAINRKLHTWAGESIGGVQVANLSNSYILAATWMVGCNLLITTAKARNDHGLATPTYSTIVGNALSTIPTFSNAGVTVISYWPATHLQIKGLPTWDPTTNRPVKLTLVFQTLDGLGIFEGVKLIKNGPAPSDTLSWAWDPKTFNAESRPCVVTVRFYNNDG